LDDPISFSTVSKMLILLLFFWALPERKNSYLNRHIYIHTPTPTRAHGGGVLAHIRVRLAARYLKDGFPIVRPACKCQIHFFILFSFIFIQKFLNYLTSSRYLKNSKHRTVSARAGSIWKFTRIPILFPRCKICSGVCALVFEA